jgi:hypothetical protein
VTRLLAEVEREYVLAVLSEYHGDRYAASRALGIGRTTLYRKLGEWGIASDNRNGKRVLGNPAVLATIQTPRFIRLATTPEELAAANAICPSCKRKVIL